MLVDTKGYWGYPYPTQFVVEPDDLQEFDLFYKRDPPDPHDLCATRF